MKLHATIYFFIIFLISSAGSLSGQELLGNKEPEIRQFLHQLKDMQILEDNNTQLIVEGKEEDEVNRLFNVSYSFLFKEGICNSYMKEVPSHIYWVSRLQEWIDFQQGKEAGEPLIIEDEILSNLYKFEDYVITIGLKDGKIRIDSTKNP